MPFSLTLRGALFTMWHVGVCLALVLLLRLAVVRRPTIMLSEFAPVSLRHLMLAVSVFATQVGKLLYKQAAGTVKKISLELGGNAPFIVYERLLSLRPAAFPRVVHPLSAHGCCVSRVGALVMLACIALSVELGR